MYSTYTVHTPRLMEVYPAQLVPSRTMTPPARRRRCSLCCTFVSSILHPSSQLLGARLPSIRRRLTGCGEARSTHVPHVPNRPTSQPNFVFVSRSSVHATRGGEWPAPFRHLSTGWAARAARDGHAHPQVHPGGLGRPGLCAGRAPAQSGLLRARVYSCCWSSRLPITLLAIMSTSPVMRLMKSPEWLTDMRVVSLDTIRGLAVRRFLVRTRDLTKRDSGSRLVSPDERRGVVG
jgi:hypothetical protein